jgi:DNA helicase-2/ATP-dependent DNA helicase PcrA
VLDEAQDYSPAQHIILSKLFGACKLTLVGDSFQLINPVSDISRPEDIAKYYPAPAMVCRLSHSYRSTIEISLFADSIAGKKTAEHFERHGKPVSRIDYASQGELISRLAEAAGACAHLEGSTVILTKTARKAQSFYHRLKPCLPGLSLLTEGGQPYRSGLWVIPVVLAKGLEFDRVFVADFDDYDFERDRGLLYVACTRAMHELCICTSQPDLPQNLTERT